MQKTIFVIPCFNEGTIITSVIREIQKSGNQVLCVDDGSTDNTFSELKKHNSIIALRHPINMGQGAAIETGFEWVRRSKEKFEYVVTFDADGQHRLEDALKMIEFARVSDSQIVLGSRFLSKETGNQVPRIKRFLLRLFAKTFSIRKKIKITDRHNGLRVIQTKVLTDIKLIKSDYSHADEFLELIDEKALKFSEYPVQINYTKYSKDKGQPLSNGLVMLINRLLKI